MSQDEARVATRRAYGGVEQAKQLHRNERSILWLEQTGQNLRYAFRQLRKAPGFTLTVCLRWLSASARRLRSFRWSKASCCDRSRSAILTAWFCWEIISAAERFRTLR